MGPFFHAELVEFTATFGIFQLDQCQGKSKQVVTSLQGSKCSCTIDAFSIHQQKTRIQTHEAPFHKIIYEVTADALASSRGKLITIEITIKLQLLIHLKDGNIAICKTAWLFDVIWPYLWVIRHALDFRHCFPECLQQNNFLPFSPWMNTMLLKSVMFTSHFEADLLADTPTPAPPCMPNISHAFPTLWEIFVPLPSYPPLF